MNENSKSFQLGKKDVWSIIVVSGLVGVASSLAYLVENMSSFDFGESGVFLVPVATAIITAIIRWIRDYTKTELGEKE